MNAAIPKGPSVASVYGLRLCHPPQPPLQHPPLPQHYEQCRIIKSETTVRGQHQRTGPITPHQRLSRAIKVLPVILALREVLKELVQVRENRCHHRATIINLF